MDEVALSGGNTAPVMRVGATVRRVTGEWTPAVHALLAVLEAAGIRGVPRARGVDERGREILSFIDGEVLADAAALWSDTVLQDAGRLLRRIHDASTPLAADATLVWRSPRREPAEVVCHNDFATYNLIVRGGEIAGVIDFDFASPGPRLWDLAYLAYKIVPFASDAAIDADDAALDRAARLDALIESYGVPYAATDVTRAAADRLDHLRAFTLARAAETGRDDLSGHAAMYGRDAAALRAASMS